MDSAERIDWIVAGWAMTSRLHDVDGEAYIEGFGGGLSEFPEAVVVAACEQFLRTGDRNADDIRTVVGLLADRKRWNLIETLAQDEATTQPVRDAATSALRKRPH